MTAWEKNGKIMDIMCKNAHIPTKIRIFANLAPPNRIA